VRLLDFAAAPYRPSVTLNSEWKIVHRHGDQLAFGGAPDSDCGRY